MRFEITVSSAAPIENLTLTVWRRGVALGSRFKPNFVQAKQVNARWDWNLQRDSGGGYLPPGTTGEYSWHIADTAGNQLDTPLQSFRVEDKTHAWKKLSNDLITLYWDQGDDKFGAGVFQRANEALAFLSRELNVTQTVQEGADSLQIFIYGDRDDFFRASEPGTVEWTGGRTFPEYGVIMINFDPTDLEWGLGATSHELTHAVLHEKIKSPLSEFSMPHWMDEGVAVYNQAPDHSGDDQFNAPFKIARDHNMLLTLRSLTQTFSPNPRLASLAYGESYSAVKFMIEKLGADKFAQLLQIFRDGAAYDDALQQVYGVNMDGLENLWRQDLGVPLRDVPVVPTVTPGAVPTFEISTALTPDATLEPTRIAADATPLPRSNPATPAPAPAGGLCGGVFGFGALVVVGLWGRNRSRLTRRRIPGRRD